MSFIKRACLYILRKKGKSTLLFCLFLIIATFVLTGISIGKATEQSQKELRQSLGGSFDISVNYTDSNPYLHKETTEDGFVMYSSEQLSYEMIEKIREIDGVQSCDASDEGLSSFEQLIPFDGTIPVDEEFKRSVKTVGVWRSEENKLFTSGELNLIEGRHITEGDTHKVILCRELAEKNGIKVGDIITTESTTGKKITLEVIGLFVAKEAEAFGKQVTSYDKIQNRVFMDLNSSIAIEDSEALYGFSDVNVTVTDPEIMDEIMEQVKKVEGFKTDAFTISIDDEIYQSAASSLERVDKLVMSLLVVIVIVSIVILSLLLTLWERSRVHEIGIFLSVGIKKIDIIGQYLMEILLIAILAFGLSFFTSNFVSDKIASMLLQQSIQNETTQTDELVVDGVYVDTFGSNTEVSTDADIVNQELKVSVSMENLILLYAIGFAIILISVTISSVTIMRLKPREILAHMS